MFDPGSRHTKVVKNGTSSLKDELGTQTYRVELGRFGRSLVILGYYFMTPQKTPFHPHCQDNLTGCCIISSVWGIILQRGSSIKVNIELPVATRHHRDMTEKLLKAMLNPSKQ